MKWRSRPASARINSNVQPIAFYLGSFPVHWYGVMMALAFLAGLWTAGRRGRREGIASEKIVDIGPWLIVGGILGARTVYVATYWQESFAGQPIGEIFMVQHGGLVFYGGLIGAALAGILFAAVKKLPLWKLADILAPSIALGYVFGRIGCLLNGCCYGRACDLPWAIHFPPGHETYPHGVHPTEIYDSLLNLGLFATLAWFYKRRKFDGQVFGVYVIAYSILRSFVEYFRGDYPPDHIHNGLTSAQLVSIPLFVTGLLLAVMLSHRGIKRG